MKSVSRSVLSLIGLFAVGAAFAAETSGPIDPQRMSQTVKVLASDEFEGRAPGTPGETKTDRVAHETLPRARPRAGRRTRRLDAGRAARSHADRFAATLSIAIQGKERPLTQSRDIYVSTVRKVDRVSIEAAPLVFVGYGVTAPERQWDDYKRSICAARSPCI